MRRLIGLAGLFLGLMLTTVWAADDAEKINDLMTKIHNTKKGLRTQIETEVKKDSPNWEDVQKKTKEYLTVAEPLPKLSPGKGDKKSWEKLTKEFLDDVKAIDAAAKKKDAKGLLDTNKKLATKCDVCHDVHQP